MKNLLLIPVLLLFFYCKKKENTSEPSKTTPPTVSAVPDKTVSITCQTGCGGILNVDWNYDWFDSSMTIDSVYNYTSTKIFTKTTKGDSIRLYWSSSVCSTCGYCPSQISVTVNGIVKQSWSNDNGLTNRYIKLP